MMLGWFNAREATEVGTALADHFTTRTLSEPPVQKGKTGAREQSKAWQDFLQRADRAIASLRLNFYKKAKFANSFKWRLLEKGIERGLADELTHTLLMRISRPGGPAALLQPDSQTSDGSPYSKFKDLLADGDRSLNEGDFAQAVAHYEDLLRLKPNHADAHQNLGAALFKLARYADAELHLRQAVKLKPKDARALRDLGNVLRITGRFPEAQDALRRSLKLDPGDSFARSGLGTALMLNGDLAGAKAQFEKSLKLAPRNAFALVGLAQVAAMEGDYAGS